MAIALLSGSFAGVANSAAIEIIGEFNFRLDFSTGTGVGTVEVQRSFDGGATWQAIGKPDLSAASFTGNVDGGGKEVERGILYRLRCTAFTSGTIAYRLSR